ncbi:MAG TPA: VOC family protein [Caulobacteraceae bacterium]|jgi:PhnB protein
MGIRPERYRSAILAHIYVDGAAEAVEFYKKAFGAEELFRVMGADGRILHGELSICGSIVMIGDPTNKALYGNPRKLGGCSAGLHIIVDDNKALLERATAAGAKEVQPVTPMFYGATSGSVRDPYGHVWVLLTWQEDLSAAEMQRRGEALLET